MRFALIIIWCAGLAFFAVGLHSTGAVAQTVGEKPVNVDFSLEMAKRFGWSIKKGGKEYYRMGQRLARLGDKAVGVAVYAGPPFSVSSLKVDGELELPLVIKIAAIRDDTLIPEEGALVPIYEKFDPNAGTLTSKWFTQAANVTWVFAEAGLEFVVDGTAYRAEKAGARITFTKEGVKFEDVNSAAQRTSADGQHATQQEIVSYSIEEQRGYSLGANDGTPAQLRHYFAEGTVSVGGSKMKVVGGILLDGKPVVWVEHKGLSRQRRLVTFPNGAFPALPSNNQSRGVLTGFTTTGVRFSETLFMSPAPSKGGTVEQNVPLFFFYLSPLSGATWSAPKDTPAGKKLLPQIEGMELSSVLPDLYAYQALNKAGKVALTRRPYFVATVENSLSSADLVRVEELELPRSTQVSHGIFATKLVIALQGLEGASEFPDNLGKPLTIRYNSKLSDANQWNVEDGSGTKSLLLRQDVPSSGTAVAVYGNGIKLDIGGLLETLRDSVAVPRTGGE